MEDDGSVGDFAVSCYMNRRWLSVTCTGKALAVKLDQGSPFDLVCGLGLPMCKSRKISMVYKIHRIGVGYSENGNE